MTCPGCSRSGVALIGGLCGRCSNAISSVAKDIEDVDIDVDLTLYDVGFHKNGQLYVMFDVEGR